MVHMEDNLKITFQETTVLFFNNIYEKNKLIYLAKKSLKVLNKESIALISNFILSKFNDDGGFRGKSEKSDLYYTLFGLETMKILGIKIPGEKINKYLLSFETGNNLDFVHLICLARSLLRLKNKKNMRVIKIIFDKINKFMLKDDGYRLSLQSDVSSIYASFLAFTAFIERNKKFQAPWNIIAGIKKLQTPDGGYADKQNLQSGTTTVTSAALILLKHFKEKIPKEAEKWLWKRY